MAVKQNGIEIVKRFAELGFQVQPEAIELLSQSEAESRFDLNEIVENVTDSLDPSIFVISTEQIADFIKNNVAGKGEKEGGIRFQKQTHVPAPAIIKSFSDNGRGVNHKDFLPHFLDRYERISEIIKRRMNCRQIRYIRNGMRGEEVSVVGMVASVNKTAKGNIRVELEDATGHLQVILRNHEGIIPDEIIGVTGSLSDGGYLFANRVTYPDVPIPSSTSQSSLPLPANFNSGHGSNDNERGGGNGKQKRMYAVFISDMHVGSSTFLEEAWGSFVQWLKEESRSIGIAYLVVAGDIVDGIGVYPGQEEELSIMDIEEQYKIAAGYFHDFPSHIHVVVAPGNHDAVRNAEPQPPLPEDLRKLFPDNTCFVSNPAYIKIGGRLVLIYHGQSYDDFVNSVSRLSYSKPDEVMAEMLKRRHVALIYGKAVSIVPDGHDYGVIDRVPDIFHCGHTHTVGISKYRNVLLINSGTWQSQTPYQKKRNINPVPGCATLVELSEMKVKVMEFGSRAG
ncbi:MAG: DNA-directed DNA polymerase II small subunit [Halobacteriota archaeon]